MKIAVVGGGGFRAPYVWESVAEVAGEVPIDALVLHDVSEVRLARIEAVIEGLRRERGGPPVTTTTTLDDAVDGADVVLCAIRVGGLEGRVVDETVSLSEGVLGQETVGPGGLCFALRTLPAVLSIARVVRQVAPSSWFLNFTNPAGLITEALQQVLGDRAVGICDAPAGL
ncbi:MAG: 6-phospho-beta-glucosidase, partial [Actinomycetota bacterium]|nr:6-phospho-beta-glucosidase [Actinomycetota bacterium]